MPLHYVLFVGSEYRVSDAKDAGRAFLGNRGRRMRKYILCVIGTVLRCGSGADVKYIPTGSSASWSHPFLRRTTMPRGAALMWMDQAASASI